MPRKYAKKSSKVKNQRSKNKSWKLVKVFGKIKHGVKLAALSFVCILISVIFMFGLYVFKVVKTPFASGIVNADLQDISKVENLTLSFTVLEDSTSDVSKIKSLYLVILNTVYNTITLYEVPTTLSTDLPERYGVGEISKVYALGESSAKGKGVILVNKTLEKLFAKRIDRYILTDAKGVNAVSDPLDIDKLEDLLKFVSVRNLSKSPQALALFKEHFETNLTFGELGYLGQFFYKVSDESISRVLLSEVDISNSTALDRRLKEVFVDSVIVQENKRVVVLNGAGVPKLGTTAARFLEKFGVSIADVDNASKIYDKSVIVTSTLESKTLERVSYELGILNVLNPEVKVEIVDDRAIAADIVVIVGIDYASSL